ncbi:ribosomal RNA-processing protein 8 [Eublepharis macularius]|uniref:Ribosomal RNA-processing protein 8 n=1 Tax=Eublepharis macularius TaxID=481883 RepID=A0AA97KSF3_EUBMA|nr:ribosomal RNA-processing protein 8 [Eublepharis macularius]
MFEEGAWSDAEGLPGPAPARPPPRLSAASPRRLRATLRRLQALGDAAAPELEPDPAAESPDGRRRPRPRPNPPAAPKRRKAGAGQEGCGRELSEAGAAASPVPPGEGAAAGEQPLSRRQWRNRQKNRRRQKNKFKSGAAPQPPRSPSPPQPPTGRAASLRLRLEERLEAARFRYLNQQLYSRPSREAARLFQEDPAAFAVYHRGFARQVARWPEKPVQRFVRYLRHRPASLVVADFGCGDCALARSIRNPVHCFDVVALDPRVTVCDMAQVPLDAASVDVAVFCLALMGTNLCEILEEANRVLRVGGTLLVAEVASRFVDLRAFLGALARLGFQLVSKDTSGSYFYTLELRKAGPPRTGGAGTGKTPAGLALLPCLYKRR